MHCKTALIEALFFLFILVKYLHNILHTYMLVLITILNKSTIHMNKKLMSFSFAMMSLLSMNIATAQHSQPQKLSYQVINTYPHDQKAYTQCLEFHQGVLYESTGNGPGIGTGKSGVSSMRHTDFKTGKVTKIHELPSTVFGEGCTILNNQLYQLTYKNNEAYRYHPQKLTILETIPYFKNIEGWGLTNDGKSLYMSDGSNKIYVLNPQTFKPTKTIHVTTPDHSPVNYINELEWVNGKIYANIFTTHYIVMINPKTGLVEQYADLAALRNQVTQHPDLDYFNGIAYHPQRKTFFVTGKNWDKVFEIKFK